MKIVDLTGKKWGNVKKPFQDWLLKKSNCVNGVNGEKVIEGACIIDFEGYVFSVVGKVVNGEIKIQDEAVFYNPTL